MSGVLRGSDEPTAMTEQGGDTDACPGGFRHSALFYDGDDEFLDRTLAFVRAGLAAGEPALVVVDARKIGLIRDELDGDAEGVEFLDMALIGRNPARIIPRWQQFVDERVRPGTPGRGIGEPIWPQRSASELSECQRHERLLNLAFDGGTPWKLMCPYDTRRLGDDVLEEARRSHPILRDGATERPSDAYEPETAPRPFAGELAAAPSDAAEFHYGAGDLPGVRRFAAARATEAGLAADTVADLVLAVSELATNSVRHATGAGRLRLWTEGGTLLCEICDGGLIDEPLVGRIVPPADAIGGRGIWIVNQLCDLVQVRSSERGTVIRLHMAL